MRKALRTARLKVDFRGRNLLLKDSLIRLDSGNNLPIDGCIRRCNYSSLSRGGAVLPPARRGGQGGLVADSAKIAFTWKSKEVGLLERSMARTTRWNSGSGSPAIGRSDRTDHGTSPPRAEGVP